MANNGVSQHFKIDKGLDLASDSQFATLGANTKIVYKPSGEKYVKNPNYSNVFDKTDTFGDLESSLKAQAVRRIENSGNPDGTTNYYSIDGTKLGSFISGVSPNDLSAGLGNVRSTSISAIDDANASGVCSCKNTSGTQIDTFTCHVSKTANNPTLSWGQQATIGTVDGTAFKVTMPANPNTDTKYSAGTGLSLSGTTFNVDIPNYNNPHGDGGTNALIMLLDNSKNYCRPSSYTLSHLIEMINEKSSGDAFGEERTLYAEDPFSVDQFVNGNKLYSNAGGTAGQVYDHDDNNTGAPSGPQTGTWIITKAAQKHHAYDKRYNSNSCGDSYWTETTVYSLKAKQLLY